MTLSPAGPSAQPLLSDSHSVRRSSPSPDHNFPAHSLANPRTQDVFQSIVKGRKSWKTLRGGEVVWPPELEAALIEGLENYQPDDSRETRLLGRFPLRNRFISDWIFDKTGKRRTAKQVGSRLQQLRDTCGGKRLLNLLSPTRRPPCRTSSLSPEITQKPGPTSFGTPSLRHDTESCSDTSSPSSPTTPTEVHATLQNLLYRGINSTSELAPSSIVYIELLPDPISTSKQFSNSQMNSASDDEELLWRERGFNVIRISPHPRQFQEIDPTITFTSRSPTSGVSIFSVYLEDEIIHSETVPLRQLGPLPGNVENMFLYSTPLVPGYWHKLSQCPDLTQYTIIHRIVENYPSSQHSSPSSSFSPLFSTMYRFKYSSPSLLLNAPSCSSYTLGQHVGSSNLQKDVNLEFPFETLLSMGPTAGYSDITSFDKPQNLYDLGPYMRPDWNSCQPASSAYQGSH